MPSSPATPRPSRRRLRERHGPGRGQDRVSAPYGDHYDRPAGIERVCDPQNLFRANQNIAPAAPA
ncbi:BBE domain-containing protein [Streptomyces sp. NBC_00388]|uniref:BBE domain-containing protein n=1 Tax=Streptomyces sp. NBC_00388 TaxID=2975735 RepID=UPI002E1DE9F0